MINNQSKPDHAWPSCRICCHHETLAEMSTNRAFVSSFWLTGENEDHTAPTTVPVLTPSFPPAVKRLRSILWAMS